MWFKEKVPESTEITDVKQAIRELQSFMSGGVVDTEEFTSKVNSTKASILGLKEKGDPMANVFAEIFRNNFKDFSEGL